jgi:YebC/PmpR family DNA-binding regulatory protein
MAGHSHWARIKRAKAVTDARRGRAWSKLSRAIIMAARAGPDPDANLALRYAIEAAKAENMPKDTIQRAIKKGSGELEGQSFEELVYEGYGPGGAAVLATSLTDNRARTAGEVRKIFERRGGNLAGSGSVAWMFQKRGVVTVPAVGTTEDALTDIALECGADDVKAVGDSFELRCDTAVFEAVRGALTSAGVAIDRAEITMVPTSTLALAGDHAERVLKLVEELEEHDDIQNVYSNFDVTEEDMARLAQ